jgi:hypothetical protein
MHFCAVVHHVIVDIRLGSLTSAYTIFVGEIGMWAKAATAPAAWADFVAYSKDKTAVLKGWTWWAAGAPEWWDDEDATDGGHFSITPTLTAGPVYSGDNVNMKMIEADFK